MPSVRLGALLREIKEASVMSALTDGRTATTASPAGQPENTLKMPPEHFAVFSQILRKENRIHPASLLRSRRRRSGQRQPLGAPDPLAAAGLKNPQPLGQGNEPEREQ